MNQKEIWYEGTEWTELAQYRVQWWALVEMLMNLEFP
jgi:hypothetical protein